MFGPTINPGHVLDDVMFTGGTTMSLTRETVPLAGFAVSVRDCEHVIPWSDVTSVDVGRYVETHHTLLTVPGYFLGAWLDDGRLYLDVTMIIEDRAHALDVARRNAQLAIFDLSTGETVRLDSTVI
jgi:hypothetical protein